MPARENIAKGAVVPRQHIVTVAMTVYMAMDYENSGSRRIGHKFG